MAEEYDPFRNPVASQVQQETRHQLQGLSEAFGARGGGYGSSLMAAQAKALADSGERIGSLAWDREQQYIKDLFGMGMAERGITNEELMTLYNIYNKERDGDLEWLSRILGPGYTGEWVKGPQDVSSWEKASPWINLVLELLR